MNRILHKVLIYYKTHKKKQTNKQKTKKKTKTKLKTKTKTKAKKRFSVFISPIHHLISVFESIIIFFCYLGFVVLNVFPEFSL